MPLLLIAIADVLPAIWQLSVESIRCWLSVNKEKTMRHLALSYGVEAIYMPELANGQEYYFAALRRLLKEGRLCPTDMVGYLSSGKEGTQTSFLEINVVEDALKHAEDSVLPNSNRYL